MTRRELIERLRSYLNRPNLPEDAALAFIDNVTGELNALLKNHPRNRRRATYTQPAGNDLLPLPGDILSLLSIRKDGEPLRQFPVGLEVEAERHGNAFIECGNCVELYPAPSVDTEYRLIYTGALVLLASEIDTNWVLDYFPDTYLYGCLKEAAVYLKDNDRLQVWQAEFMRRVDAIDAQGWNQNESVAPRIEVADD